MKRNKGIAIELTALLDVILIMLFWIMMSMKQETEEVRVQAQEEIDKYEQMYIDAVEKQNEALELQSEAEKKYESLLADSDAAVSAANQKALDEYAQGRLITMNLRYDAVGKLFIFDESKELGRTIDSKESISDKIDEIFKNEKLSKNDVILCAFVYDGSRALYSDVNRISAAVEDVNANYKNLYCTYINISR